MKRHIGKIKNTDQRCVVVFMQIPGREDHALVVPTDSLPGRFEQALMQVVESREGQAEATLGTVLNRRVVQDTGENLLEALHQKQLMRAVHIDQVMMLPLPNMPFPLRQIIDDMGGSIPGQVPETAELEKFNPHAVNTQAMSDETRLNIARNLIVEADLLRRDYELKLERAYNYAPELRPRGTKAATVSVSNDGSLAISAEKIVITEGKPKRGRKPKAETASKTEV